MLPLEISNLQYRSEMHSKWRKLTSGESHIPETNELMKHTGGKREREGQTKGAKR